MKKVAFLITVFLLTGISLSFSQKVKIGYHSTESRSFEPRQGVIVTPLLADLKILTQNTVCDSIDYHKLISEINPNEMNDWTDEFKKQTMSYMLKKYKADAIVAPLTEVKTTDDGYMRIIITGYPAKYVNFRLATADDVWMSTLYNIIDRNTSPELIKREDSKTVVIK